MYDERGGRVRPVPEYDAKSWLLKALRETAHAMESLLWDLDEDALNRVPEPGEWSCTRLVAHMGEMEQRYIDRLERIVRMEEPKVAAFDADSIEAEDSSAEDESVFEQMDEFSVQRRQAVYLLWSLDDADWERRGIHPYLGPLTITQVAREMNEHDLAHLWQLRRLCDRFQAASV
jgi:DinB superfamily